MTGNPVTTMPIGGFEVPFRVKKGKPGRLRLFFSPENELVVETGSAEIGWREKEFIGSQTKWLVRAWKENNRVSLHRQRLLDGLERSIILLGKETEVNFIPFEKTRFRYHKFEKFEVYAPEKYISSQKKRLLQRSLHMLAAQILPERLAEKAVFCEVAHKHRSTAVKEQSSRWGSCSSDGRIHLNWQLIFLEEEIIDYVIVHELMHLHEMNHGPRFKELVSHFVPNWKQLEKKLKENQWMIGILK